MSTHVLTFIASVDAKRIERANGQAFDLHQVHDSDGNTWVVKKPLADFARTLVGQQVELVTRQETKVTETGEWQNFYADSIIPSTGAGQTAQPQPSERIPPPEGWYYDSAGNLRPEARAEPEAPVSPSNGQEDSETPYGSAAVEREKRESINRSVAVKAAAVVCSGDQYVFWTMLRDLMGFLDEGKLPKNIEQASEYAEKVVNASAEGASMPSAGGSESDDDIPFDKTF